MRRYRACIWCKILATAARESHFDTVKIENFSGVDMTHLTLFVLPRDLPVFSRADPDLIRGMWDVAQDVADVWGSPAVDLDRALTKAWWEGLMGPRRPTRTSYQLNVSKRSGTVWIPIETRKLPLSCVCYILYIYTFFGWPWLEIWFGGLELAARSFVHSCKLCNRVKHY